jgi:hypothetical protein
VIAKVTSGGGFRGVLDYLMNQKGQQKELENSLQKEAKRTPEVTPEREGMHRTDVAEARKKVHEKGVERELNAEQKGAEKSTAERELSKRQRAGLGEPAERHRIIGGNMSGQTPRELAREFGAFREQRPDIAKPVHHASLSAAKGEKLSIEKWSEIAEKYVEKMGFSNSPYIVIQHLDTEHEHLHIVTSRIDTNGKVVSDFQSKMRAEKIMREVECEHDLQRVQPSREIERRAPTRGELEELARTGERSAKMRLQDTIDRALRNHSDTTGFISHLEKAGVRINPNLQSTNRVSGISFEHGGEVLKGSNLGRGYSWQGLQKRGLEYDEKRDLMPLKEAKVKYLETQLDRQQELAERLAKEAPPIRLLSSLNPANIAKAQLERYAGIENFARALNPVNSITKHPLVQVARAVNAYAERRQEAAQSRELAEETKREIAELQRSLPIRPTLLWEPEHDTQSGVERNPGTPEELIDAPSRSIPADLYFPQAPAQIPVAMSPSPCFDPWQTPGNEQSRRKFLQDLNSIDQNMSGPKVLARAASYQMNQGAEELLREATQSAYQGAEERDQSAASERQYELNERSAGRNVTNDPNQDLGERDGLEQQRPVEVNQSPETLATQEIAQEIEHEAENMIGWELLL